MKNKKEIGVNVQVPRAIHKKAKTIAANFDMKLKEYVVYCIKKINEGVDLRIQKNLEK